MWYLSICSRKYSWAQLGHTVSSQAIILGVVRDFHFCKSSFLATNSALRRHPSWLEHRSLPWHPSAFMVGWKFCKHRREKHPNLYLLTNEHLAATATLLLRWTQKCVGHLDTTWAFVLLGVKRWLCGYWSWLPLASHSVLPTYHIQLGFGASV